MSYAIAGTRLGCSARTIRRYVKQGRLPALGGRVRSADLDRYILAGIVQPGAGADAWA